MSKCILPAAAAAIFASVFLTGPVQAQSLALELNEKYVDTIMARNFFTAPNQDTQIYTVPQNRFFRLTDVIVTNTTGQVCDYRFFVGSSDTGEFTVQPRSTFTMHLNTGLLYKGPDVVTLRNTPRFGGALGCGLVTITGVLTKKATKKDAVLDE
ncbi:hypothetical protein IHQ68_17645 [Chelatococcus sambhunathii]|uniref:Uncharacterized protein n=1 Tax=Chelatococcus sambhunathii TaxID=363953 RepID=A0ABU1DK04_9HYPH|nr:hypothetical protein [Chelatococcus sambhunathii]MDR4308446.1 hypothetical protein [Chelatococcus sambhunathii]